MKKSIKTSRTIKGEFSFDVRKDTEKSFYQRFNCKGMMKMIERSLKHKDRKLLLEEYAKYWLADKLGIKELPLKK